jgi:hypothetical protein
MTLPVGSAPLADPPLACGGGVRPGGGKPGNSPFLGEQKGTSRSYRDAAGRAGLDFRVADVIIDPRVADAQRRQQRAGGAFRRRGKLEMTV